MSTRARRLSISVGGTHLWSHKLILTILCLAILLDSPQRSEQQRDSATFEQLGANSQLFPWIDT